jgi:hypothetical protein
VKVFTSNVGLHNFFPLGCSWPEVTKQLDLLFSIYKLDTSLSPTSWYDGKGKIEIEGYSENFIPMNQFDFRRVEIEISEVSIKEKGISDEILHIWGDLQSVRLLDLHIFSIYDLAISNFIYIIHGTIKIK